MKIIYFILIVLMFAFSCGSNKVKSDGNIPAFTIKELSVADTFHIEQIKSIISTTDCFTNQPKERNIVYLIYGSYNVVTVGLDFDIGDNLENINGGFYEKIGNRLFLFVVNKSNFIPSNLYEFTEKEIDVKERMNFTIIYIDSDAEWSIRNDSTKFELLGSNCW